MDLRLGCREKTGEQWIYYLRDGSRLSKEKWTELVKQQVERNEHKQVLEHIKSTVTLWNKQDTVEEIALQVYASKYCTRLQLTINKPNLNVVKDEMGCSQLSFY